MALLDFIAFLSKEGLVDITNLEAEDDQGYENMLKIHRYAYIAMHRYDLGLDYAYGVLMNRPYSTDLTKDCEELDPDNVAAEPDLPAFKKEEFLSALKDKSSKWIDVAGMIVMYTNENKSMPKMKYIYWVISDYSPEFIDKVYADMRNLKIA